MATKGDLTDDAYLKSLGAAGRRIAFENMGFEKDKVAFAARAAMDDGPRTMKYLLEVCTHLAHLVLVG